LTAPADSQPIAPRGFVGRRLRVEPEAMSQENEERRYRNLGTSDESNSAAAVRKIKFTLLHLPSPLTGEFIQRKMSELRSPGTGSAGSLF